MCRPFVLPPPPPSSAPPSRAELDEIYKTADSLIDLKLKHEIPTPPPYKKPITSRALPTTRSKPLPTTEPETIPGRLTESQLTSLLSSPLDNDFGLSGANVKLLIDNLCNPRLVKDKESDITVGHSTFPSTPTLTPTPTPTPKQTPPTKKQLQKARTRKEREAREKKRSKIIHTRCSPPRILWAIWVSSLPSFFSALPFPQ